MLDPLRRRLFVVGVPRERRPTLAHEYLLAIVACQCNVVEVIRCVRHVTFVLVNMAALGNRWQGAGGEPAPDASSHPATSAAPVRCQYKLQSVTTGESFQASRALTSADGATRILW